MAPEERIERLAADVAGLRVAQARLRGRVNNLEENTPAADGRLQRDVDRLAGLVDRLTTQVDQLQRWRWQVTGIAAGVAFVAEPVWQAVMRAVGAG